MPAGRIFEKGQAESLFVFGFLGILLLSSYLESLSASEDLCSHWNNSPEQKDRCLVDKARYGHGEKACPQVQELVLQQSCWQEAGYRHLTGYSPNDSTCKKLSVSKVKDSCYFNLANATDRMDYCKKIQDEKNRTQCLKLRAESVD